MDPRGDVLLAVLTLAVIVVALATVYLNRRIVDMQRRETDLATSNNNTLPPQRPLPHQEKYSRTSFIMK